MSEAFSIHSSWTVWPRMSMPRIASACGRASSRSAASLMPPAFPRPPISTCRLPTAAERHLRRDDDGVADLVGGGERLVDGRRGRARGDRHAVALEELLSLVLEQVQERRRIRAEGFHAARVRGRMALPSGIQWV